MEQINTMMKQFILALLVIAAAYPSAAQPSDLRTTWEYEHTKLISVGYTYQHLSLKNFNSLLEQNGYGAAEEGMSCLTVTNTVYLEGKLGFYYSGDFGSASQGDNTLPKYKNTSYLHGEVGVQYRAIRSRYLEGAATMGIGYGFYTVRLYDRAADSSINSYVSGPADAKRMQTSLPGINIGVQARLHLNAAPWIGIGGGCIIPLGTSVWQQDSGNFQEAPAVLLGTWYTQIKLGFAFHRRIIHLPQEETEKPVRRGKTAPAKDDTKLL